MQPGHTDVYHVSQMKPYAERAGESIPPKDDHQEAEPETNGAAAMYRVDCLLARRTRNGRHEYKVAWTGWPRSQATWLARKTLIDDGFEDEIKEIDLQEDQPKEVKQAELLVLTHAESFFLPFIFTLGVYENQMRYESHSNFPPRRASTSFPS